MVGVTSGWLQLSTGFDPDDSRSGKLKLFI